MSNILLKAGAGCGIAGLLLAGAMAYGTVPFNNTSVAVLDLDRVQQEADAYEKVKTETEKDNNINISANTFLIIQKHLSLCKIYFTQKIIRPFFVSYTKK